LEWLVGRLASAFEILHYVQDDIMYPPTRPKRAASGGMAMADFVITWSQCERFLGKLEMTKSGKERLE
jgi:hypothetical protein